MNGFLVLIRSPLSSKMGPSLHRLFLLIILTLTSVPSLTGRSHGVLSQGGPLPKDESIHILIEKSHCEAVPAAATSPASSLLPKIAVILVTLGLYSPSFRVSIYVLLAKLLFRDMLELRGKSIGHFSECSHGLRGEVVVLNERELLIKDFHYRGDAPAAYFHATLRGSRRGVHFKDYSSSITIPFPGRHCGRLPKIIYRGATLILLLPVSIKELQTIGVMCYKYCHNFGHLVIPENLEVPAASEDMVRVKACRPRYPFCSEVNEEEGCPSPGRGPTRLRIPGLLATGVVRGDELHNISNYYYKEEEENGASSQIVPFGFTTIMFAMISSSLLKFLCFELQL